MTELLTDNLKSVGFLGFGRSNACVYDFLHNRYPNLSYTVREARDVPLPFLPERSFYKEDMLNDIDEDILFISPTVKRDLEPLLSAKKRGTVLSSDAELFFSVFRGSSIGVSGTSGKSTVTYLCAKMLSEAGISTEPIGNYGNGFCHAIDKSRSIVAELSSFQLSYLEPSLDTAVLTAVGEDHLNWHKDLAEYVLCKGRLFSRAKKRIVDADSQAAISVLSDRSLFCAVTNSAPRAMQTCRLNSRHTVFAVGSKVYIDGEPFLDLSAAKRSESYNFKNFMLSCAAVFDRVPRDVIERVAVNFGGLPHRAELVLFSRGISFINSSIDTSPQRALSTLEHVLGYTVPIFCGTGKGLSFDRLADKTLRSSLGAVLMGEVGEQIGNVIKQKNRSFKIAYASNMNEAVAVAADMLKNGGTVILSPAGASYDKYQSFEERGDDFSLSVLRWDKIKG